MKNFEKELKQKKSWETPFLKKEKPEVCPKGTKTTIFNLESTLSGNNIGPS